MKMETPSGWMTRIDQIPNISTLRRDDREKLACVIQNYPMRVTDYYSSLIDWDDPEDPIRKLSLPSLMETDEAGELDTSGEASNTKFEGLQHKYETTALVLSTNVCYMYCRHCFRKRMVGSSQEEINRRLNETVHYIQNHKEINNVLITGGDAFALSNQQIKRYLAALTEVETLDYIRFGTRTPVVYPSRITDDLELLSILRTYRKKKAIWVVTQFNHPRELTAEAISSIEALLACGIQVNNQMVLLKGVNDDPKIIADLMKRLIHHGVNPYYIFQCRPVKAVKNQFQVSMTETSRLVEEAKAHLDGFSKRFKLIMSHPRGKIEILGQAEGRMLYRFHQAKHEDDQGRFFSTEIVEDARWLNEDLKPIK
ncbi:KamA family radical SAM protein [Gottschalkiaceae bacterium SANA]|nr:KamA family radical SAM protein [Gottschalkiaceae bacterium SANA]